jgi:peptidoglycan hydrolase CwlO-like protein
LSDLDELEAAITAAETSLEQTLAAVRRARAELAGDRLDALGRQLQDIQATAAALERENDATEGELVELQRQVAELERGTRLT